MIPILMTVFALGGTTFGMAEESLAFYVLIITVMIAAGYDALVGASVILLLGCGIGALGSTVNPFATGIASGFADISLSDGLRRAAGDPDRRHGHRASGSSSATPSGSKRIRRRRSCYDHEGLQRGSLLGRRPTTAARWS